MYVYEKYKDIIEQGNLDFFFEKVHFRDFYHFAIENGLIVSSQKEDVLKTIYEIVNHQDLSLFFSNEHKILNEKTIIQKEGNLVIPDRMVLTKLNEIYLLDYKTGKHQTKYQLQLENYQKAIEKMGFKVTKKALVYIGDTLEIVNLQ